MLEVGGGDLQGVEHEAGGFAVDLAGSQLAHDLAERDMDGGGILERGEGERRVALFARVVGVASEVLFVLALVVIAETGVAHGGRSAVGAAQHDVHALVGQTSHNDYPCLSRCFAISGLAGFCDLISGLQRVRGKILKPN